MDMSRERIRCRLLNGIREDEKEETVLFSVDPVIEGSENNYKHEDITLPIRTDQNGILPNSAVQEELTAEESVNSRIHFPSISLSGDDMDNESTDSVFADPVLDDSLSDTEDRILLFDKTGNGFVHFLKLTKGCLLSSEEVDVFTEKWQELVGLRDYGVCQNGEWVYIIGGHDIRKKTQIAIAKRYSLIRNKWENLPDMFVARSAFGVTTALNKIYITGGERINGRPTRACEAFDLQSQSWERVGLLPEAVHYHACATDGRRVYVSGGINKHKKRHRNVWLSENFTWNETDAEYPTLMSSAVSHHCMHMRDGTLYFFAGIEQVQKKSPPPRKPPTIHPQETRNAQSQPNTSQEPETILVHYEVEDGTIQTVLCQKCSSHQITLDGRDSDDESKKPKRRTIKQTKRTKSDSVTNGYYIYNDVDGYVLSSQNQASRVRTQDLKRTSSESFMPFVTSDVSDDSWFISPWDRELPALKHPRHSAASIIIGDGIYVLGGAGHNGRTVRMIEFFDFNTKTWTSAFKLPRPVHAVSVSAVCIRSPVGRNNPPDIGSESEVEKPEYRWVLW